MTEQTNSQNLGNPPAADVNQGENISGRGVFVIETVAAGVAVRTAFLAEDGRLIDIPAVFPDLMYAMAQIDELRQHVARRFAEAAQIGSQVIAQQIEMNRVQAQAQGTVTAPEPEQSKPKQVQTSSLNQGSTQATAAQSAQDAYKDSSKESKTAIV